MKINNISYSRILRVFSLFIAFLTIILMSYAGGGNPVTIIPTWLSNSMPLLFLSLAAAIIISSGNIDIALGAIMSLLGMFLIFIISFYGASLTVVIVAHFLTFLVCIFCYSFVCLLVNKGFSALIVTLALFFMAKGASTLLHVTMQGVGVIGRYLGTDFLISKSGVVPYEYVLQFLETPLVSLLIALVLIFSLHFWRFHTLSGLRHVATGANVTSAKYVGVDNKSVYFCAFILVAGLVYAATFIRLHGQAHGGWTPNTGWGEEMLAIAVAVIGGTRISGGRFEPVAVWLSSLVVYSLRDVVTNDLRLPSEATSIAFGLIMLLVVALDSRTQKGK